MNGHVRPSITTTKEPLQTVIAIFGAGVLIWFMVLADAGEQISDRVCSTATDAEYLRLECPKDYGVRR